jgi:hypothetical protein
MISTDVRAPKPRRILDRSDSIARREEDLARALVITLLGDLLVGAAELVLPTIAHRFEIEETRLCLRPWGLTSFLLILPSVEMAELVYNGGCPIITPSLRLHVMRWTRFLHSSGGNLPCPVDVEVRGVRMIS